MRIFCFAIAWVLVQGQAELVEDFDLRYFSEDGSYEFIYRRNVDMLMVVHNQACYFTHLDDRYNAALLSDFSQTLMAQVISAVSGSGNVQPKAITEDEVSNTFHDPEVQSNVSALCDRKDFYLFYPDIFQCDFEQSTCAWRENQQNPILWQRQSGVTATTLTGPDDDHTLQDGTGHYLYVESSGGSADEMAEIISPIVSYAGGICLRFWYNMYGEDVGSLLVFDHAARANRKMMHISGDQGHGWHLAELTVARTPGQVHIQALLTGGHRGDIAIDDISSTFGYCPHTLLDCRFDKGVQRLCYWSQTSVLDNMQWTLKGGSTDTAGTGPDDDMGHSRNGEYLYLEGNDGQPGDTADLESPLLQHQGPICFSFYYFMWGSGVGELDVIQRVRTTSGTAETILLNLLGEQGQKWLHATVTIAAPDPDNPIQIVIRATRGNSAASDIAIDALTATSGTCEHPVVG